MLVVFAAAVVFSLNKDGTYAVDVFSFIVALEKWLVMVHILHEVRVS